MCIILVTLLSIEVFITGLAIFYSIFSLIKFCFRSKKQNRLDQATSIPPLTGLKRKINSPMQDKRRLIIDFQQSRPQRLISNSKPEVALVIRAINTRRLNAEEDSNRNSPITSSPRNLPLQNLAKSQDTLTPRSALRSPRSPFRVLLSQNALKQTIKKKVTFSTPTGPYQNSLNSYSSDVTNYLILIFIY